MFLGQQVESKANVLLGEPRAFLDAGVEALYYADRLKEYENEVYRPQYEELRHSRFSQPTPSNVIKMAIGSIENMIDLANRVRTKFVNQQNKRKAQVLLDFLTEQQRRWLNLKKITAKYPYRSLAHLVLRNFFEQKTGAASIIDEIVQKLYHGGHLSPPINYVILDVVLGDHAPSVVIANTGTYLASYLIREGYNLAYDAQLRCDDGRGIRPATIENYTDCSHKDTIHMLSVDELNSILKQCALLLDTTKLDRTSQPASKIIQVG